MGQRAVADVRAAPRSEHAVVTRRGAPEGPRFRERVECVLPDRDGHAHDAGAAAIVARRIGMAIPRAGIWAAARAGLPAARGPVGGAGGHGVLIVLRWLTSGARPGARCDPPSAYA